MTALLLHCSACCSSSSAILASIGLHELGHMIPAKKFGVKVTQYFVGFGRTVWSHAGAARPSTASRRSRSAATSRSSGCCRPARSADEVTTTRGQPVVKVRKSNTGMFTQLISDARAAEWEHVEPGRRRPALLQDALVEEGHRDGRRPDGEPR